MPASPDTLQVLQSVQSMILNNLLVKDSVNPVTAGSPFSALLATDQAKYGISKAVFVGVPKTWRSGAYTRQCHIMVLPDNVAWRTFGGTVWDYVPVYIRILYSRDDDWYTTFQDMLKMRDVMYPLLLSHAEGNGSPTVDASVVEMAAAGGAPLGYHQAESQGREWDGYGFAWKMKQKYQVTIVP